MFLVSKIHLDKASDGMMDHGTILRLETLGSISLWGKLQGSYERLWKNKRQADGWWFDPKRKRVWVLRKPQRKEKYLSQFKVSVSAKEKINIWHSNVELDNTHTQSVRPTISSQCNKASSESSDRNTFLDLEYENMCVFSLKEINLSGSPRTMPQLNNFYFPLREFLGTDAKPCQR